MSLPRKKELSVIIVTILLTCSILGIGVTEVLATPDNSLESGYKSGTPTAADRAQTTSQSDGYASIVSEDPERGKTLDSSQDVTIEFTVDYDTAGEDPGYISVSWGEDQYEQPHKEVNINQQSGSKDITITQSVNSNWDQAVLDINVWPESSDDFNVAVDGDNIEYSVDDSGGGGGSGELPSAHIECEINIEEGQDFTCFGDGSEDPDGYIDEYEWEFDDNTEYGESAEFYAFDDGYWIVYLTVTDNDGNTDTSTESIDISEQNVAPEAEISCDSSVTFGEEVACSAAGTSDPNENIDQYEWEFDDGTTATGTQASHTYDQPGTYTVGLTVTDTEGLSSEVTQQVNIEPTAPEIHDIRVDQTVMVGETVELSARTTDPGGLEPLAYSWTFGDESSSQESFTVRPSDVGTISGELRVTNTEDVSTTETFQIEVEDQPPEITRLDLGRSSISAGDSVDLSADVTDPASRDIEMTYEWKIADKTYQGGSVSPTLTEVGIHEVTLTVKNEYGTTASETETIRVENVRPDLDVSTRSTIDAGSSESFSVNVNDPSSGSTTVIMFSNGEEVARETVTEQSETIQLTHSFNPGTKSIRIEARDEHGESVSETFEVEVDGDAPEIVSYAPEQLQQGVSTGDRIEFSISVNHPDGAATDTEWVVDGERVKRDSTTFSKTFTEHKSTVVEAVVTDEYGITTSQTWQIQADTFRESPRIEDHTTAKQLSVEEGIDILTFSFRNPEANDRSAVVEIRAETPDGISVSEAQNLDEMDGAQSAVVREVAPGFQEDMSLGVTVNDESLNGEEVNFEYEVLYYPEDSPETSVQIEKESIDLYVGQDGTNTGNSVSGESSDDSVPGFGFSSGIIAVVVLVIGSRLQPVKTG